MAILLILILAPLGMDPSSAVSSPSGSAEAPALATDCAGYILADGAVIEGALANSGAYCNYVFPRISGMTHAKIELTPASSDFDLYVHVGNAATTTAWACRPFLRGAASETCTVYNDLDVTIHVRSYSGGGAFTLRASALTLPTCSAPGIVPLENNTPVTTQVMDHWGDRCVFAFTPSAGFDAADVILSGAGAGNGMTLFVRDGTLPTRAKFDCVVETYQQGDRCTLSNTDRVMYAMVVRYAGSGSATVTARGSWNCSLGPGPIPIEPGVPIQAYFTRSTGGCLFAFEPSAAHDVARFELSAGQWQPLRVRVGAPPTTSTWDCQVSLSTSNATTCKVATDGRTVYVKVYPGFGSSPFTLTAGEETVPTLLPGVPIVGASRDRSETIYKLVVPEGATMASFELTNDPRDLRCRIALCLTRAEMAVSAGRLPTLVSADCEPWWLVLSACIYETNADRAAPQHGEGASVATAPLLAAGKYFVVVRGYVARNDLAPDNVARWTLTGATA